MGADFKQNILKSTLAFEQYEEIFQISDPQRALALADTAEMLNLLRPAHVCLNAVKAMIYQNGLGQRKLAIIYETGEKEAQLVKQVNAIVIGY